MMGVARFIQLGAFLILQIVGSVQSNKTCEGAEVFSLHGNVVNVQDGIIHNNLTYPIGSFVKKNNSYYGCPCRLKPCLPLCPQGKILFCWSRFYNQKVDFLDRYKGYTAYLPEDSFQWTILDGSNKRIVTLLEYFYGVPKILPWSSCRLKLKRADAANYNLLSNGSFELSNIIVNTNYCIAKVFTKTRDP
jgi:hypothetical protein